MIVAALALTIMAPVARSRAADCSNAATQSDMNICADQAFRRSDAALNSTYRQITDRLKTDAAARGLLVTAQKAWLAFRDADCAFASSAVSGGSIYPMIVTQCRDALTQDRTRRLAGYLKCAEGDLSCPVPAQ